MELKTLYEHPQANMKIFQCKEQEARRGGSVTVIGD
jgi:hypothetical protein